MLEPFKEAKQQSCFLNMCTANRSNNTVHSVQRPYYRTIVVSAITSQATERLEASVPTRDLRVLTYRVHQELDKMQGGAAMQLALAARPSSRCNTVPQLFAGGEFIGGCSDALVLHAQGKLEPILRKAAAQALPEGEKGLPSPVGRPGSPFDPEESFRPTLSRSLSA